MSFSAEMKDFLGGFQTVESVFARQKQMQIAQQRANDLAAYHAQLGNWADAKTAKIQGTAGGGSGGGRGRGGRGGRGGVNSETAAMDAASGYPAGKGSGKAPATDTATDPRSDLALKIAVDATDPSNATDNADGTDSVDNPSVQQKNAGGGPIQKFAGGGAPTPTSAIPPSAIPTGQPMPPPAPALAAPTPAPAPTPALAPAPPAPNPPMQAIPSQPPALAPNASIQNGAPPAAPQPAPAPPTIHPTTIKLINDKATQAMVAAAPLVFDPKSRAAGDDGKPGMSPQELDAAVNATDPNGEMPAFLKQAAFLAKAYDHFNAQGDHKRAAGIAAEVLKSNLYATQTLGTLAVHAFSNGDIPNACRIINDACNRFPSGHDISIRPDPKFGATYTVADDSGKVVEQGVASTAKIYEMAKGIRDGSLYLQQMARTVQEYGPKQTAIQPGGLSGQAGVKQKDFTPQKGGMPRQAGGSGGDTTTPSVDYTPIIKPIADPTTGIARSPNGAPPVAPGTPAAQAIPTATHPDPSIGHAPPPSMSMITPEQAAHVKDVLAKGADPKAVQQYLLAQGVSTQGM